MPGNTAPAAIAATGKSDGWQDIPSAPRDGTLFLGWWKAPRADEWEPVLARWSEIWGEFIGMNVRAGDGSQTCSFLAFGFPERAPCITHWQPLPPPPEAAA